jgi:hypothetical protein
VRARDRAVRDARAVELHLAGVAFEAIARTLGYGSRQAAHKAVRAALADHERPGLPTAPVALSETDQLEVARLDVMLAGLWMRARRGDVAAVDRVLRLGERRTSIILAAAGAMPAPPDHDPLDEIKARRDAKRRP